MNVFRGFSFCQYVLSCCLLCTLQSTSLPSCVPVFGKWAATPFFIDLAVGGLEDEVKESSRHQTIAINLYATINVCVATGWSRQRIRCVLLPWLLQPYTRTHTQSHTRTYGSTSLNSSRVRWSKWTCIKSPTFNNNACIIFTIYTIHKKIKRQQNKCSF